MIYEIPQLSGKCNQNLLNPEESFRDAMFNSGCGTPDPIIADGTLHRCHIEGDRRGSNNGWYVLFPDTPISGGFGSWKTGITNTWCAMQRHELSQAERTLMQQRHAETHQQRLRKVARRQDQARGKAEALWAMAEAADPQHPYLLRKSVKPHKLRQTDLWRTVHSMVLLVPMCDWDGTLHNLQAIFPFKDATLHRDKDFLAGGRKKGLFYPLGEIVATGTLLLAEGFATGATLFEQTQHPTLICFDCGNLKPVAIEARHCYPKIDLVIAADNDRFTPGNPGLSKAREAAIAARARLLSPQFAPDAAGSDWNDFMNLRRTGGAQ